MKLIHLENTDFGRSWPRVWGPYSSINGAKIVSIEQCYWLFLSASLVVIGCSMTVRILRWCYVLGQTDNCTQDGGSTKNCINQRAHGFYSNRIHTAGSVWITDTITNVMIHYNTSPQKCCAWLITKGSKLQWQSFANGFKLSWRQPINEALHWSFEKRDGRSWRTVVNYYTGLSDYIQNEADPLWHEVGIVNVRWTKQLCQLLFTICKCKPALMKHYTDHLRREMEEVEGQ